MLRLASLIVLAIVLAGLAESFPADAGAAAGAPAPPPILRHVLEIRLEPATGVIHVSDTLTWPPGSATEVELALNARLSVTSSQPAIESIGDVAGRPTAAGVGAAPQRRYRARLSSTDRSLRLRYEGALDFPLSDPREEYTRGFRETIGLVGPDGVYLSGDSFWYPHTEAGLLSFDMTVTLPDGWRVISQGKGISRDDHGMAAWSSEGAVEEIFLVGGPLQVWSAPAGPARAEVYLRAPDDPLVAKYLEATAQYLKMYGDLIAPYPFEKFSLVENFWETGYGMPSFTLLGPQILRFPFIVHSSYPHEILHNWWGNSVFVASDSGNWCEGLTAYMADHLIQEQRGKGEDHRRAALQRYRDYVQSARDFPLREFRARHSAATEAVGYGRTMMGFHMLRLRAGDDAFRSWASRFYREMRGRRAGFDDVRSTMEAVTGQDLSGFFEEWVDRPGAPALETKITGVAAVVKGFEVRGVLRQTQGGEPFHFDVPLVLQTEEEPVTAIVRPTDRDTPFTIHSAARPVMLHVDPAYDVFRRLDPRETPATIGRIFGEPKVLALLPSSAPAAEQEAYRSLVEGWRSDSHDPEVRMDAEVVSLPADRAVWILGRGNRFGHQVSVPPAEMSIGATKVSAGGEAMSRAGHSLVITARHPGDPSRAIGWIVADPMEAVPGLGRKLPHYGRYSWLGFEGSEPVNVLKGEWSASDSPLRIDLRSEAARAAVAAPLKLPARSALADLPPVFSTEALRSHVERLAQDEMEGRGIGSAGLDRAAGYIARQMEAIGLTPGGDGGGWLQWFATQTTPDGAPREIANVVGVLPGSSPAPDGPSVLVGAHYDHLGLGWPDPREGQKGKVHPGADDNASGVAVMLELARAMAAGEKPTRAIVFVAFTGEEAGLLGSRHYAQHPVRPLESTIGMINLDTVGRLRNGKISVLASGTATEWPHIFRGVSYVTGVESRLIPESLESSDQKSLIDRGVPAVQLFTEPHEDYHRPTDTADKVDTDGLVKVAAFTREALVYLAGRAEPLTVTIVGGGPPAAGAKGTGGGEGPPAARRVTLGTVPDFGFAGPGVKVSDVVAGSPAEAAGVRKGDILLRLDGEAIASLKGYSDLLRTKSPGQTVQVTVLREGQETVLSVTLAAR